MFRPIAALLAPLFVPVAVATAQVTKPTRSPTERLPAPQIAAAQQSDGSIRVTWSAVDGATRYTVTRSVPPTPAAAVTLPNPSDTSYVDRDVQPGSTYYYLVGAINEAGMMGLRASAPPVTARHPTDLKPPEPPRNVVAVQRGGIAEVSWGSSANAARYIAEMSRGATSAGTGWIRLSEPRCCFLGYPLEDIAPGTRVHFRITAEGRTGFHSAPATSNEIVISRHVGDTAAGSQPDSGTGGGPAADSGTVATTNVRPAVVPPAARLKVGASLDVGKKPVFTNLRLQKVRWVSLDDAKATVDARGKVVGRAVGVTYVVATGLTPQGAVASLVQRVDVTRR